MENLMVAFLTLSLYFFLKSFQGKNVLDFNFVFSGLFLGLAILTKQSASLGYILIIIFLIIFLLTNKLNSKRRLNIITKTMLTMGFGYLLSNIIRISKNFEAYNDFTVTHLNDWSDFSFAIERTIFNLTAVASWLKSYLTPAVFFLLIIGLLLLVLINKKKSLYFLAIFIIPILFQSAIATDLFPRYFLITIPAILAFLSMLICKVWEKIRNTNHLFKLAALIITILIFLPLLNFDLKILFNINKAPLHYNEHWQYISNWPSGYGVEDAANFIKSYKKTKPETAILVDGHNGHLKDSLIMSGVNESDINYVHRDEFIKNLKNEKFNLIVANREPDIKIEKYKKIAIFEKPGNETAISIFEII
jgi:hypothetical protein